MSNTVVLARPHPFIATEMRPLLEGLGYQTKKPDHLADLDNMVGGAKGAVVSLALSSPIGESAEAVVRRLGAVSDKLPLIFTSMLPFEQAKQNLGRLAQAIQLSVTLLGVDDAMANASKLGKRETFVYLSKEDITDPTRRRVTEKLISQHFR
jgi:hypothetical protein